MRAVLFFHLALWSATQAIAAQPPDLSAEYTVQSWQIEHGLPQNSVRSITSDDDGYLWFGTEEGLVRYDGAKFRVFDSRNTPLLSRHAIGKVIRRPDGRGVWAGTSGGGVFEADEHGLRVLVPAAQLQSGIVTALCADRDGAIWIGTREGLSRYKDGVLQKWNVADGLANNYVRAVFQDTTGRVWVGTYGGLNFIQDGVVQRAPWEQLAQAHVRAICQMPSGRLYFGTHGEGLFEVNGGEVRNYRRKDGVAHDIITDLASDAEGSLWIAAYGGGMSRFRHGEFASLGEANGLPNPMSLTVYPGADGVIWLGQNGGGLVCLRPRRIGTIDQEKGLSAEIALPILQTRDGAVWVGTAGGGVTRFHGGTARSFGSDDGLPDNVVLSLGEDQEGGVWIGTAGAKGVARYKEGRFQIFTKADGLADNMVTAILCDKRGRVLLGMESGGLSVYDGEHFTTIGRAEGLSNETVLCLLEARDGDLWIGTRGGGVNRLRNGKIDVFLAGGAIAQEVLALHQDARGDVWAGTGKGLFRIDSSDAVARITSEEGLPEDQVLGIAEDEQGSFWLSSNRGIARVPQQELADLCDGKATRVHPVVFGKADGMKSIECNSGVFPSAARLSNGEIWFPTTRGVAVINPGAMKEMPTRSRPGIESFTVDGHSVDPRAAIRLPAFTRHFEFAYSIPAFRAPERVHFRYRLDGFDENWSTPTQQRSAHYTALPGGNYTFRVSASDKNGAWSAAETTMHLEIVPPFHQTKLFYALIACAGLGSVAGGHYLRLARLNRYSAQLEHDVSDRTAQLACANDHLRREVEERKRAEDAAGQAREQAEAANCAKSEFLSRMSHELRTPLNAILGFSQLLLRQNPSAKQENHIEHIVKAGRHLLNLINEVLDISRIEAGRVELSIEAVCVADVLAETLDLIRPLASEHAITLEVQVPNVREHHVLADRQRLKQVLLNLLGNGIKYTPEGGRVTSSVQPVAGALRILITDSGPGIPEEKLARLFVPFDRLDAEQSGIEGTGLGLAVCQRLMAAMSGAIGVESVVRRGSTFWVELPRAECPVASATAQIEPRDKVQDAEAAEEKCAVLYIEDNLSNLTLIEQLLCEQSEVELITASDANVGLALASSRVPDLILLDLHLPDTPGSEVLAQLKAQKTTSDIPVIIISADATARQVDRLLAAGAYAYLTKPIDIGEFFDLIEKAKNRIKDKEYALGSPRCFGQLDRGPRLGQGGEALVSAKHRRTPIAAH
ncbi:MAG TPA: two-component regulator propeller domain-containing protein [Chthoniobacterales bacterium]|nr:two-component regulator propeller domain-containing protein [Chthoniobacterales bacterium]